jgi:hypothetical protein
MQSKTPKGAIFFQRNFGETEMLERWFVEHPRSVGETYVEHLKVAASFGASMIVGGLACFVHALLPNLFRTKASRTVASLHERMVVSRTRRSPIANAAKR